MVDYKDNYHQETKRWLCKNNTLKWFTLNCVSLLCEGGGLLLPTLIYINEVFYAEVNCRFFLPVFTNLFFKFWVLTFTGFMHRNLKSKSLKVKQIRENAQAMSAPLQIKN
jgi:hypothetical protein